MNIKVFYDGSSVAVSFLSLTAREAEWQAPAHAAAELQAGRAIVTESTGDWSALLTDRPAASVDFLVGATPVGRASSGAAFRGDRKILLAIAAHTGRSC